MSAAAPQPGGPAIDADYVMLAERLLPMEHALYPAVLRRYAADDRRLVEISAVNTSAS